MCLRCVRASVPLSLFSLSLSLSSPPSLSLPFYSCLLPFYIPFLYEFCCLYLCLCLFACLCLCHFSCRCLSLSLVVSLSLSVTRRVFVYTYTKSHTHAQYHTQMIEHARDSEERLGADRSKHITPLLGCFHHLSKSQCNECTVQPPHRQTIKDIIILAVICEKHISSAEILAMPTVENRAERNDPVPSERTAL